MKKTKLNKLSLQIRSILFALLLSVFAIDKVAAYRQSWFCEHAHKLTTVEKEAAEVNVRRKYSGSDYLKSCGIKYNDLNNIIKSTSNSILENYPWCGYAYCFESILDKKVEMILKQNEAQHNTIKGLSPEQIQSRVSNHKAELVAQYTKPEQLSYYNVSYYELMNILNDTLNPLETELSSLFYGSIAIASEASVANLLRKHKDNFLAKLNERRNR